MPIARFVFLLLLLLLSAARAGESAPDPDPDIELAGRLERAFQKLAKRVAPSVVSLKVEVQSGAWMDELRRMNENLNLPPGQPEGSGVIVDPAGFIITNEHVVRNAKKNSAGVPVVKVVLADGREFAAVVTGTDPRSDLAMVKLTGDNVPASLPCAVLADSDAVEVGQWALAVGNPFGLSNTLTVGVISARGRSMPVYNFTNDVFYGNLLQTDAAINPGNSGGPLFDMRGKLIGINTMIFSRSGISQGFGFAIPSKHLEKRLAYLKNGQEVEYGWLGVSLRDVPPAFGAPENKGALVDQVIPDTPADRAGLEKGMVILELEGTRIKNTQDLIATVNETPVGRTVKIKLQDRDGKPAEKSVRISKRNLEVVRFASRGRAFDEGDERPPDIDLDEALQDETGPGKPAKTAANPNAKGTSAWRGLQVKELSADDARKKGGRIEVTRVKKGTPADRAGLYEGAVLTEIKHGGNSAIEKLGSLAEFETVTHKVSGPAAIHTVLDGYVTVGGE